MTLLEGKLTHSFNCLTPPLAVKLSNVFFFNLHQQKQFQKAMNLVGEEFLDRVCFYRDSWLPARGLVKEALCKRQEVHLAVLIHSGEKDISDAATKFKKLLPHIFLFTHKTNNTYIRG